MSQYGFRQEIDALASSRRLNHIEFAAAESAKQAYLYAAAYILTYIWPFCDLLASSITGKVIATPEWFHFHLAAVFLPLQGFWNFLIYTRPIVSKIRRDENDDSLTFIAALKMIIVDKEEESNTNTSTNADLSTSSPAAEEKDEVYRRRSILSIDSLSSMDSVSECS